ncbi:MAG TPA: glycosyltransferase family 2 protein, partial [Candidatus Methylomirabilis sp.]|nr:glycosyltransferase family 2 protein [Candidatus Methylomirabilis sp.]
MSDHLIVIPAFDEAPTLERIVTQARKYGSVLVVDDGSADGSAEVASAAGADVVRLDRRQGKGGALRRGFHEGLARGVDRVVTLDADGQHDPDNIPRLLKAAAASPDALVIGGRLRGGGPGVVPPGRLAALRVAGFFINWLTGRAIADTQSGFRVYPAALLRTIATRSGRFVLETEILIRAAAAGWRLVEVPIATIHSEDRRSRFRPVRDGIAVGAYLGHHIVVRWAHEFLGVAAALARPFTAERRRPRHRAHAIFTAGLTGNPGAWALATGVFTASLIVETWSGWWRDPRARCLRLVGVATAATPILLPLALIHAAASRWTHSRYGWLETFTSRVYSQDALARVLPR